jgi:hypothetical protein
MTDHDRPRSSLAIWLIAAIVILPVVYVLSLGPAVRLFHGSNSPFIGLIAGFYSPLEWLARNCEPIGDVLGWYIGLWRQ